MQHATPKNYKIHIEPDLLNFNFAGTIEMLLETQTPIEEITLDVLDIAIWECNVKLDQGLTACPFTVDTTQEKLKLRLPQALTGEIIILIEYQGHINDLMAGFYRSKYLKNGQSRYIAVTQFEESDARRAFPCMDHPARKATFDISIDVDPGLVAISNSAVKEEKTLPNGKKRVVFQQTPQMSTYLVFLGVGEFEIMTDKEDPRVRAVSLPGMQEYAHYGLDFGRKSLQFSEDYYGIPYPLPKMDLIAIPDFAFGAMENWGAITFRENLLLYYPEITSRSGEERICEVIAHEIAHQWFGNLVTPSDWKYLWLNESFATYFGFGVVAHYYPQWDIWGQFLNTMTASAMLRDALLETFAIEIPGGEHVVINSSTAPIIYNKGGSILRQIQGYIGDTNFQNGLRHYLKRHEYDCADSHHLWEAFEAVSEQPVTEMMQSWIEQPGFPIITAKKDGNSLVLSQKRFSYLPNTSDQTWLVPVNMTVFRADKEPQQELVLLDTAEKTVALAEDTTAYKLNRDQTGFYRVAYLDTDNLEHLGRLAADKQLAPEDRWGLQNDLYARVRSADMRLADYLKFLTYYKNEDAYLPLTSIATNLAQAHAVVNKNVKSDIAELATPWLESVLEGIGFEPEPDEKFTTTILRDQIIWEAVSYGSQPAADFAASRFEALMQGNPVHPDIIKSVMLTGAFQGDATVFDWFNHRLDTCEAEHERMNILTAIGCFKNPQQIARAQQYVLEKVPPRNKFIPVVALASNPHAVPSLWDWYIANLKEIEAFHPMLYERVVGAIIPAAGLERPQEIKTFFDEYMHKTELAKDVIKLSLERLEINLRMREANF